MSVCSLRFYTGPDPDYTDPVPNHTHISAIVNKHNCLVHHITDTKVLSSLLKSAGDQREKICLPKLSSYHSDTIIVFASVVEPKLFVAAPAPTFKKFRLRLQH